MAWNDITISDEYKQLSPRGRARLKQRFFEESILPDLATISPEGQEKAFNRFMETPDDTGEGLIRSALGSAARGFFDPLAAAPEVAGAYLGIEGLEEFGGDVRGAIEGAFPVNPAEQGLVTDVAGVLGQVGQIVATGGGGSFVGGKLIGKGATELAKKQAEKFGARAAVQTAMGSSAVAGGLERAEQLGLEGGDRLLRGAIAGGTELLAERLGGFATELGGVGKAAGFADTVESGFMKPIIRGIGTEAGEEGLAEAAGQATDIAMAPEAAPGMDLKNIGYAMLLGGVGGAAFGGIEAAITPRTKKAFDGTTDFIPSSGPPPGMTVEDAEEQDLLKYGNAGEIVGYVLPVSNETIEGDLPLTVDTNVEPLVENVAAAPEASATASALRRIAAEGAGAPAVTQEIPDEIVTDETTALRDAGLRMLTGQAVPAPAQADEKTDTIADEWLASQPKGMQEVIESNVQKLVQSGLNQLGGFVGKDGELDTGRIEAYRKELRKLGFDLDINNPIGDMTLWKKSGVKNFPVIPLQKSPETIPAQAETVTPAPVAEEIIAEQEDQATLEQQQPIETNEGITDTRNIGEDVSEPAVTGGATIEGADRGVSDQLSDVLPTDGDQQAGAEGQEGVEAISQEAGGTTQPTDVNEPLTQETLQQEQSRGQELQEPRELPILPAEPTAQAPEAAVGAETAELEQQKATLPVDGEGAMLQGGDVRQEIYTSSERDNFKETPRGERRDRFAVSGGVAFDRFYANYVAPPAFKNHQAAVDALNNSIYNESVTLPVSLGQNAKGEPSFTSSSDLPEVIVPKVSAAADVPTESLPAGQLTPRGVGVAAAKTKTVKASTLKVGDKFEWFGSPYVVVNISRDGKVRSRPTGGEALEAMRKLIAGGYPSETTTTVPRTANVQIPDATPPPQAQPQPATPATQETQPQAAAPPSVKPSGEQPPSVTAAKESTAAQPAEAVVELTELPSYFQRNPQQKKLWDVDESYAEPARISQSVGDKIGPRGTAFTVEQLMYQIAALREFVSNMNGRLLRGGDKGASTKELAEKWTTLRGFEALAAEYAAENPQEWQSYRNRQNELLGLEAGADVIVPYPSPDTAPLGNIGKLDKKFSKNWRVIYPNGETALFHPTALRAVSGATETVDTDVIEEVTPLTQAQAAIVDKLPELEARDAQRRGLGFDYPRARIGRLPGDQNAYISRPDQKNVGVLSPDGSIKMLSPEESVSIQGEINAFEKRQAAQIDKRMATLREEAKKQSESKLYQLTPSDPVVRRLDGKWINNNTGKPLSRSKNDQRLLSQLENNPNIESYQVVAQSTDGGVSFIPASRAAQPAAEETGDAGVARDASKLEQMTPSEAGEAEYKRRIKPVLDKRQFVSQEKIKNLLEEDKRKRAIEYLFAQASLNREIPSSWLDYGPAERFLSDNGYVRQGDTLIRRFPGKVRENASDTRSTAIRNDDMQQRSIVEADLIERENIASFIQSAHLTAVNEAAWIDGKPVSAEAVKVYEIALPEGYALNKNKDLYVKQDETQDTTTGRGESTDATTNRGLPDDSQQAVRSTTASRQPATQEAGDTGVADDSYAEDKRVFLETEEAEWAKQSRSEWDKKGGKDAYQRRVAVWTRKKQLSGAPSYEQWLKQGNNTVHMGSVSDAVMYRSPVSVSAVETYGIEIPEGYVKQGDLYVFAPQAPETKTSTDVPETDFANIQAPLAKLQSYISTLSPKAQAAWTPERLEAAQSYYATGNESALEPLTATQRKVVKREGTSESDAAAYEAEQKRQFALRNPPAATDSQFLDDYNAYVNSLSDETLQQERESREKALGVDGVKGVSVKDPLGYGNALIALFPSLKKAGVQAITIEEAMERLEAEWRKKQASGKATRLDQLVYMANKKNTQSALEGANIGGIWTRTDKTVAVSNNATPSAMAHEIGHAIMELEYANAPEATKKAIEAEYSKWFADKYGKDGVPSVADQRRIWEWMTDADWMNPDAPFPQEQRVAKWEAYRAKFSEWFADEVAKWAATRDAPKSLVDKFFSELAQKLKKLWDAVRGSFSPNETLASWLDSISEASPAKTGKPASAARYSRILRSADGSIRRTGVKSTPARAARNSYIGVIPGVENTWLGTVEEFDAEFPDGYPFDSKNNTPPADTEALVAEDGRAFIFIDRVQVLDGDAERAEQHGTSPGVEAIKRLLRHESFVHRGFMSLPGPLKARFADFVASGVIPEAELDYLVNNGYPQYKGWRDNKTTEMLAAEEWLAQRVERMGRIPQSGPIASIMDWLRDVWRWLTGGETTDLDKLRNTMRAMHKALGALDPKQRIVMELPDMEMLRRSVAQTQQDQEYLNAVAAGDMETAQRMVDEAARRAGYGSDNFYHGTVDIWTVADTSDRSKTFDTPNAFGDNIGLFLTNRKGTAEYFARSRYSPIRTKKTYDITYPDGGTLKNAAYSIQEAEQFINGREGFTITESSEKIKAEEDEQIVFKFKNNVKNPKKYKSQKAFLDAVRGGVVSQESLIEDGYDGVLIQGGDLFSPKEKWVVIFNPNQIKSADPVTYDSNGAPIPLSQRFQSTSSDIRYSKVQRPTIGAQVDALSFPGVGITSQENPMAFEREYGYLPAKYYKMAEKGQVADALQGYAKETVVPYAASKEKLLELIEILRDDRKILDTFGIGATTGQAGLGYIYAEGALQAEKMGDRVLTEAFAFGRKAVGTSKGQGLVGEKFLVNDQRYQTLFAVNAADAVAREDQKKTVDAKLGKPTAAKVGAEFEGATETARDTVADAIPSELQISEKVLELGAAVQGNPKLTERIKKVISDVLKRGILLRAMEKLKGGARKSIIPDSNIYDGLTLEEMEAELARLDKEIADDIDFVEKEVAKTPRAQVPKTPVETAKAIINRVQKQAAGETTRAKPKLDRVRLLYKAHLRERMAEADFMDEAKAAGLTPQVAQELYDAAELEIAAILLSKEVRGKSENYDKLTRERLKHLDVDSSALVEYINRLRREGKLGPVNWRDIMQLPPTRQQVIKGTLLELVKQNPQLQNLSAEEQQTLADALEKVWERERERQFKLQVKRLEMPGAKQEDQEKVVSATPRIIKLINQGMLAEDAFYKAVGEQFGIKEMSDADRKRIMELSEIIQDNAIPEADKAKEVRELVTLLQKYHKLTTAEILSNVWVAHVLSGVRTQFDMAMGFQNGFLNTVKKAGLVIYKNPNAKGAKTAAKGIQQFFVGLADGMAEAARYVKTEEPGLVRSDIEFINSYFEGGLKKGGLSTARKLRESDNKFLSALGSWLAILERVNTGWDVITYRATYQGTLAMAHALNPKIYKEALMPTTAAFKAMEERAKTMLGANATRAQIKSRAFQYIEDGVHLLGKNLDESFMQEWKQMATEFNYDAKEAAMMVDPTGIGGLFYRGIMGLTEKAETKAKARADKAKEELLDPTLGRDQRFIRQVFPPLMYLLASQARNIFGFRFVRFTGNKINELISYIPIAGMARIYLEEGMYRNNELTLKAMSVQMNQLIAMTIMIPAFIRAMYDLEDDDEERGYIIQGPWDSLTPERKSQLMADGFKPNTIAFYDKKTGRWTSYNYINWPSAGWFATAGSVSDYRRYTPEKWDEKTAAAKFMSGIYAGGSSFLDISSISQMTELFGRSTYSTDPATKGLEKVTKLATGYAGGFVPRIAKDVDSWFDKTVYKPEDTWGHIAKEMPFYRRGVGKQLRDIFYEPVEISRTPWSRALQVSPDDPAYKALGRLNSRGIWLTPANPENRKVKRGGKLRDMTDEEANAYMAEVGKRYKEFVVKQGDRLLEMDVDRADELVSKYTARIREIAFKRAIATAGKAAIPSPE